MSIWLIFILMPKNVKIHHTQKRLSDLLLKMS